MCVTRLFKGTRPEFLRSLNCLCSFQEEKTETSELALNKVSVVANSSWNYTYIFLKKLSYFISIAPVLLNMKKKVIQVTALFKKKVREEYLIDNKNKTRESPWCFHLTRSMYVLISELKGYLNSVRLSEHQVIQDEAVCEKLQRGVLLMTRIYNGTMHAIAVTFSKNYIFKRNFSF